jgi:DNA primase
MKKAIAPGDVLDALAELGVSYRVRDNEAEILCPYHDDRRLGNFSVNISSGVWFCFSCGERGAFPKLVATVSDMGLGEAMRWCMKRVRTSSFRSDPGPVIEAMRKTARVDTAEQLNEASLALYTDPPAWALAERCVSLRACQGLGVLWDAENDYWIFPIRDPDTNELWGWQEKGAGGYERNRPRGVAKSRTIFGLDTAAGDIIVAEAPVDSACIRTAGLLGGVATYGAMVSDEQLELLAVARRRVVFALDNDTAGARALASVERRVRGTALGSRCAVFSYGAVPLHDVASSSPKDPGELDDSAIIWGAEHATSLVRWVN